MQCLVTSLYCYTDNEVCSNYGLHGSFIRRSTDLKDKEEDVNNVNVERESSIDVLLWADGQLPVSNEKLRVVY